MSSPSHWMLGGCDNSTPLGRITVHVSVCIAPATPESSPDTDTSSGAATTEETWWSMHHYHAVYIIVVTDLE